MKKLEKKWKASYFLPVFLCFPVRNPKHNHKSNSNGKASKCSDYEGEIAANHENALVQSWFS